MSGLSGGFRALNALGRTSSVLRQNTRVALPACGNLLVRRHILTDSAPEYKALGGSPQAIFIGSPSSAMLLIIDLIRTGQYNPVAPPIFFTGDPKTSDVAWISAIHDDHKNRPWGQKVTVMPPGLQQIFLKLDKTLLDNPQLTWGHMKMYRDYLIEDAKSLGATIIPESVTHVSAEGAVTTNQGNIYKPTVPNWFAYNLAQKHRQVSIGEYQTVPHTEFYRKSSEEIKGLANAGLSGCIVGNGFSWAWWQSFHGKFFPNMCLRDPNSKTPIPTGVGDVDYSNAWTCDINTAQVIQIEDDIFRVTAQAHDGEEITILTSAICSAAGSEPCSHLTLEVPANRKLEFTDVPKHQEMYAPATAEISGSMINLVTRYEDRSGIAPIITRIYSDNRIAKLADTFKTENISLPTNYWETFKKMISDQSTDIMETPQYLLDLHLGIFDEAMRQQKIVDPSLSPNNRLLLEQFLKKELKITTTSSSHLNKPSK